MDFPIDMKLKKIAMTVICLKMLFAILVFWSVFKTIRCKNLKLQSPAVDVWILKETQDIQKYTVGTKLIFHYLHIKSSLHVFIHILLAYILENGVLEQEIDDCEFLKAVRNRIQWLDYG